jgi:SAM-dependent methyltransferase
MGENGAAPGYSLAEIFNASGSHFDDVTPHVWGPAGEATVEALHLRPGEWVLDACAGTGASALPASATVGPTGGVVAVDLAADLIALGQSSAKREGAWNIDFRVGDVTRMEFDRAFDAVCCAYGVFFLPSMNEAVSQLLSTLRPGGRFAFTVWHRDALYEFTQAFLDTMDPGAASDGIFGSGNHTEPHPITRIDTEDKISQWATSLGAVNVTTTVIPIRVARTEDFCWAMVLGSGLRGHLLDLDAGQLDDVRTRFLHTLSQRNIVEVNCDSLIVSGQVSA